jgi:hypothetical protein
MNPIRFFLLVTCMLASCGGGGATPPDTTGTYPVTQFAIGQIRDIPQENMQVEFKDVADSRCGLAALCISSGYAAVDLAVRIGAAAPQPLTVTLGAGERDRQAVLAGFRFTLDSLNPYPVQGPAPRDQYRADITVQKL